MESSTDDKDSHRCVAESVESHVASDGKTYLVISLKTTASLSSSQGAPAKEVEIAALRQGIVPCRYLRNVGTVSLDGQIKLLQSTVAVVGAGGLGCTIYRVISQTGNRASDYH